LWTEEEKNGCRLIEDFIFQCAVANEKIGNFFYKTASTKSGSFLPVPHMRWHTKYQSALTRKQYTDEFQYNTSF
jgi:hypothetical protein